jgi:hypothetical protein
MTDQTTKATRFLDFSDLMARWNAPRPTVERWSRVDPDFPPAFRFADSPIRKYREDHVEIYERKALTKREAQG